MIDGTTVAKLSQDITGRRRGLFAADVIARDRELRERIRGSEVLVIGGAGSIGTATIRSLLAFKPQRVHVVDANENALVELVRDLRSGTEAANVRNFTARPVDFGSGAMRRLLRGLGRCDMVLNFAAIKHVRSEKDVVSILQMLETNVVKCARLVRWLHDVGFQGRIFSVSTDKAADPVSLMGASKQIMEHVILSAGGGSGPSATTARFANVAFSNGSLLDGFLRRLEKRQPLAVPAEARRYFLTIRESGDLCLLASVCGPDGHVLIPRFETEGDATEGDAIELTRVAALVLRHHRLEPRWYEDEAEARRAVESDLRTGQYPVLLTRLDTSGEKVVENFVGRGESLVEVGMRALHAVRVAPACREVLVGVVSEIERLVGDAEAPVSKSDVVALVAKIIPELRHIETGKNLDNRM